MNIVGSIIFIVVLTLMLVACIVFAYKMDKREQQQRETFLNTLKKIDKSLYVVSETFSNINELTKSFNSILNLGKKNEKKE